MLTLKTHIETYPLEDESNAINNVGDNIGVISFPFYPITTSDHIRPTYLGDGAKEAHNK